MDHADIEKMFKEMGLADESTRKHYRAMQYERELAEVSEQKTRVRLFTGSSTEAEDSHA